MNPIYNFTIGTGKISSIDHHPDENKKTFIAGTGSGDIILFQYDTNGTISIDHRFSEHIKSVNSVAFSTNGKKIVSGSDKGIIKVTSVP